MRNFSIPKAEDEISDLISSLIHKVSNIESVTGRSFCTLQLRNEISRLEALMTYADVRANPRYQEFFRDESRT
jgi:hypothetical protein